MNHKKQVLIIVIISMVIGHAVSFGGMLAHAIVLSKHEVVDKANDINLPGSVSSDESAGDLTLTNEILEANRLIDIKSVSYDSNGHTLNMVFWLSNFNLNPNFNELFSLAESFDLSYGVLVDIISNNKKGFSPFDYDVSIQCDCEPENITWTKVYAELAYNNSNVRTLKESDLEESYFTENQTQKGEDFVTIPLDLKTIGFPEGYRLLFYSKYSFGFNPAITINDITNIVTIPPPTMSLSVLPSAMEMRRGETKDVTVQVNASQQFTPLVQLSEENKNRDIDLRFRRSDLNVPSYGVDRTGLTITASHNASLGSFPILLTANASYNENSSAIIAPKFAETSIVNDTVSLDAENTTAQAVFLVDVKPPLTIPEQIKGAWEDWGQAVSGFHALLVAVIAGISPFFVNALRKRFKHQ